MSDGKMLWGGRFERSPADSMRAYTESLAVDQRLVREDVWGSLAHALMLARQELLTPTELKVIVGGLAAVDERARAGEFVLQPAYEDVHMNVERHLIETAGADYGGRLHTARSRNDQVLCDARLYVRARLLEISALLARLCRELLTLAAAHHDTVMPGYTHSQHAQPITLAFWATGHVSAWLRDLRRLDQAWETVNRSPLGACALAGTDLPIDRTLTAALLGFDAVEEHALDVTASRDFLAEPLAALTILMVGLSRLAEELVWYSSHEFGLLTLSDAYTSGSSIMPQKKNPDCAELTRGKAARVIGDLTALLTCLKSVTLSYSRDLQEDKPPVWDALDQVAGALDVLAGAVATATWRTDRMRELCDANFATATQLANWLVRERRVPFRRAHEIVGGLVGELSRAGATFARLDRVAALLAEAGVLTDEATLADVLDPLAGVRRQTSLGGPSPAETRRMAAALAAGVAESEERVAERARRLAACREHTFALVEKVLADEPLPADLRPRL